MLRTALAAAATLVVLGCVETPPLPDVLASDGATDASFEPLEDWLPGLWLIEWDSPRRLDWFRFGPVDPSTGIGDFDITAPGGTYTGYGFFDCTGTGTWKLTSPATISMTLPSSCGLTSSFGLGFLRGRPETPHRDAMEAVAIQSDGPGDAHRYDDSFCPAFPDCPDPY